MAFLQSVLLLVVAPSIAYACPGGYRGVPPEGHPSVTGQLDRNEHVAGGESLYPCQGTSFCQKALRDYGGVFNPEGPFVPGVNVSMRFLNSVANLSAKLHKDLCYWSMQTLPAPTNMLGLHHINEYDAPRIMNIFGELATSRLQKVANSVKAIQFVGCANGYELRQAQCKFGQNTSVSCSPAVKQQKIKWPTSSVMLRINPHTIQEIADTIYTWRTTETGHWPNMHAPFNKTSGAYQWGYQGSLFAKIVPCDDLPDGIINLTQPCDAVNPVNGRLHADEWWDVWTNLCSIYEDPLIPSTLESCNSTETLVV
jgi:hypothetical protein